MGYSTSGGRLEAFLPLEEIADATAATGAELRAAKRLLAWELTRTVHGEAAADEARSAAEALFGGGEGGRDSMPTTRLPAARLDPPPTIIDVLVETGLCDSRGAARRLVDQGGAYVNDARVESIEATVGAEAVRDGEILLRAGKKRYHRIEVVG